MSETGNPVPKIVIRLGHMGDVALTTGVLARWFEQSGDRFVFVTRQGNEPLLQGHPAIARVVALSDAELKDQAWWTRCGQLADSFRGATLVDLHGTLRSHLLGLRWKGPVRRYPKLGLTRRLYAWTRSDMFRHRLEATTVPQRYALALEPAPPAATDVLPRIFLDDQELSLGTARFTDLGLKAPVAVLHPYATHPSKEWPREHWHALAGLLERQGTAWVVVGRNDSPLFSGDPRDLTNTTDLRQTCAVLAAADVMITNDSGPMHLASGVGTPVVALFGPTSRAWGFMPAGARDTVLQQEMNCRPCSLHGGSGCAHGLECLRSITPAMTATAAAMAFSR